MVCFYLGEIIHTYFLNFVVVGNTDLFNVISIMEITLAQI